MLYFLKKYNIIKEGGKNMCCECNNGENYQDTKMEQILSKYEKDKSNLIQILNEVQEGYGYIPKHAQLAISEYLGIPMAEIYGTVCVTKRPSA